MTDVAIVGGGVIGCAAAYYLTEAGASVTLLERDGLAGEASGAAAGMLIPRTRTTPPTMRSAPTIFRASIGSLA